MNGLFTVQIDFGAGVFQGDELWLKPTVSCTGDGSPTSLSLVAVTPAPYALSLQPGAIVSGTTSNDILTVQNYGTSNALTGYTYGSGYAVCGEGENSLGVYGYSTNTTSLLGTGVLGSGKIFGMRGYARDSSGETVGVYAEAASTLGRGLSANGGWYGVYSL